MSDKKLGQDFEEMLLRAKNIPDVQKKLESFSTVIANLVLVRRAQLGITQSELAKKAGTIQYTISRIESGDDGVKLTTLNKVFDILGLVGISPTYREDAATFTYS
jgi:DNA-binding XRE family transcriptional regulator